MTSESPRYKKAPSLHDGAGELNYEASYSNYERGELNYEASYSNYEAGEINYEASYSNYGAGEINYGAPYSNYGARELNYGAGKLNWCACRGLCLKAEKPQFNPRCVRRGFFL